MEPISTEGKIRELESVRKQINLWRTGSGLVIVVTMVVCLWLLYHDAMALKESGPTQQVFVDRLQEGMNQNVIPRLQQTASKTLTEMQPVVTKEFVALNARVPELTQKSLAEVQKLQTELPQKASDALTGTFDKAFQGKEAEIKKMYPDATEDQVKTLFTNLASMTSTHSQAVAQRLLSPHIEQIAMIQKNLDTISGTEGSKPGETGNDWGLGLAVFDAIRPDLQGLDLPKDKAGKMISDAASKVSDAAKHVADTANQVSTSAKDLGDKAQKEGSKP